MKIACEIAENYLVRRPYMIKLKTSVFNLIMY
jgi:hypothetical protein